MTHSDGFVILVDEHDTQIAVREKLDAHRAGVLHRAVSVFATADDGRVILQRRAPGKYHSGGLWSNTACTHPHPGESTEDAARRCLRNEMGIDCELRRAFAFTYRAAVGNGLIEHELDHVFVGRFDGTPRAAQAEVTEWRYETPAGLTRALEVAPHEFTAWLPLAWALLLERGALLDL